MKILLILICLLPAHSFAQFTSEAPQDYGEYHQQIQQAEIAIAKAKFQEALQIYTELFHAFDFIFLRDYKIAAQLALHLNEKEKAFEFIQKGIAAGWDLKNLKQNTFLAKLRHEPEWESIENNYAERRQDYLESLDQFTREQVHEMFKLDQKRAFGAFIRVFDKAQEKYAIRKFAPHSEKQMEKLVQILEERGYPGERLIGNNFWMSTVLSHHNSITTNYAKKDSLYPFIRPKLIEAIDKGQISPYEFALIDDWYITVSANRTQTGYGYLIPPSPANLTETNALREQIGLRSVALRNTLVDVQEETGMDFYLPDWIKGKIEVE
ncbi:hypothetical protein LAG90_04905 [Marinilongibacter aquaticus]|uniref:hypothetical protein n=1 Tax=Marinilongibacter aquaticus TaxID=2975157 RepID=UPI0021BD358E|nr:hypothetical protein [Marinilongibacter aquaticus]UBM59988.1 hypothetical protein LAG90_04905 [Marinilongibacter aquaticus]